VLTPTDAWYEWMLSKDLIDKRRALRTERRTSIPTKITFVGWNGPWKGVRKSAGYGNSMPNAYEACRLAKDTRKRMDDSDYGEKAVDQAAIFVPMVFELCLSF
jgi:hypothetical protein